MHQLKTGEGFTINQEEAEKNAEEVKKIDTVVSSALSTNKSSSGAGVGAGAGAGGGLEDALANVLDAGKLKLGNTSQAFKTSAAAPPSTVGNLLDLSDVPPAPIAASYLTSAVAASNISSSLLGGSGVEAHHLF